MLMLIDPDQSGSGRTGVCNGQDITERGAWSRMKTWHIALLLLVWNALLSIVTATDRIANGITEGIGTMQLLSAGLLDSTVQLPVFLTAFGMPATFAALLAFATWFVYAVGFFQLVTVRFLGESDESVAP
jgi:hypothetical protein